MRNIFIAAGAHAEYYDVKMDSGVTMYLFVLLEVREVVDEPNSEREDLNGFMMYRRYALHQLPDEPCVYADTNERVVLVRDDLAANLQAAKPKGLKLIKPGEQCRKWSRW